MKTYLTIYFSSEGAKPSEVTDALLDLGFKPTKGDHDYAYEWGDDKGVRDVVWFGDRVHLALKDMNVRFKLDTQGGPD